MTDSPKEAGEGRLAKTWEAAAFDRVNNEWVHTNLRSYEHQPQIDAEAFIRQAPPTVVRPSKRHRPETATELIAFYGDTHHPVQDERKLALANRIVRDLMPQTVVYEGDDLDMALFSRFETRQEWAGSTQRGIDQFHSQLAATRADIGSDAKIIVLEGNHNVRLERELRKYNGELLGLRRANAANELGVLSLEFLLRCDELGVEYVSGYPAAEYWLTPDLKTYHGYTTSSNKLVASKEIRSETVNFVHGHSHQAGLVYRRFRDGKGDRTIFGMEVGTFADLSLTPSGKYSATERGNVLQQTQNWHCALGLVTLHDEVIVPHLIPITDQGAIYNGKVYKS